MQNTTFVEGSSSDDLKPRLTFRIGVSGHRPKSSNKPNDPRKNGLSDAELEIVRERADAILDCILDAVGTLNSRLDHDYWSDETPEVRLVTSLAEGADTAFAQAAMDDARAMQLDVILPFQRDEYKKQQGFSPKAAIEFDRLANHDRRHALFELEGNKKEAGLPYLAAGRRVYEHADVLVGVWNEKSAAGTGGTAQILREALETGVPVLWLSPSGVTKLLTDASHLENHADLEDVFAEEGRFSDALSALVQRLLAPPKGKASERLLRFYREPSFTHTRRTAFSVLRWLFTHHDKEKREDLDTATKSNSTFMRNDFALNDSAVMAWDRYHQAAEDVGGERFAQTLRNRLAPRWRKADVVALYYGHSFRSAYVINFLLAAMAVIMGLTGVLWWTDDQWSMHAKAVFVALEITIVFAILFLTSYGREPHEVLFFGKCKFGQDWHTRWIDARTLAEQLRLARLPVLLGNSASPPQGHSERDDAWVEWYVRATLREIGPPTGLLNSDRLKRAIDTAIKDEIDGQIEYNKRAGKEYRQVDHALHVVGERLFVATLVVGLIFLSYYVFYVLGSGKELKPLMKSVVTLLGAGLPALGAALNGIRAMGDFKIVEKQADRTYAELVTVRDRLLKHREKPNRLETGRMFSEATRAMSSDLNDWVKIYRLRELGLPA
ncbi:hypothetical protein [Pelagibius sp. Alg239-R121]|uniref:hypothetical protein n=1 Tax=Pelagibius sp. Alg239-R121 TaxID=2993448 RepID=UPI0024A676A1|nr:hypothetical protein [Pelagibius sp. Alg239-R121]